MYIVADVDSPWASFRFHDIEAAYGHKHLRAPIALLDAADMEVRFNADMVSIQGVGTKFIEPKTENTVYLISKVWKRVWPEFFRSYRTGQIEWRVKCSNETADFDL